jgi:hypothetical protein
MFCTVAPIDPSTFPAMNTEINCPGATVMGGYEYPMPVIVFADAVWPNAAEGVAHKRVIMIRRRILYKTKCGVFPDAWWGGPRSAPPGRSRRERWLHARL